MARDLQTRVKHDPETGIALIFYATVATLAGITALVVWLT